MDTAATQQQQKNTDREQKAFARLDAERRTTEAETLRAAARDLTFVGPMDATQTAVWLTQRAQRAEHPEPPKPMHPAVFAAMIIGAVLLLTLAIVAAINGDFNHLQPM